MTSLQDLIDQISSAWPTPLDPDAIKQEERDRLAATLVAAGYGTHATHTGVYLPAWIRAGCPMPSPTRSIGGAFEAIPGLLMVRIPAGRFLMGSPKEEEGRDSDEGPQHEVTLQDFWLGETPVTQAQWRKVAGWPKVERDLNPDPSRFKGDGRPVEKVNWYEAIEFCRRLSARTGKNYTLPSEAQWEYACRAGTTTPFHFGATISTELANYDGSAAGEYREQTTDVASFPANPWGLHDMHGNVWEWCLDDWHDNYEGAPQDGSAWVAGEERLGKSCAAAPGSTYPSSAARPPGAATTPASATTSLGSASAAADQRKVLRGGSWFFAPHFCRSAYRYCVHPGSRFGLVGFRVCLASNPAPAASQESMAEAREESLAAAWDGMEPEQVLPAVESLVAATESTPHRNQQVYDVKRLADRLDELAGYVTQGPDCVRRNFTMHIPAEPYRDADLVLSAAASLLRGWLATPKAAVIEPTSPAPALPPATAYDCGNSVVIEAFDRERTSWVVQDFPIDSYLNSSGGWDYEPYLSSLSADSLARICWPSAEAAWAALLAYRAVQVIQS